MSQQHDYVIGKNAVIETLKSDRKLYKLWMAENTVKGQAQQVIELAKKQGITIQYVPRKKLDRSNGDRTASGRSGTGCSV